MELPARLSLEQIIGMAEVSARASVRTQYACQVVRVSDDGRFVDLVHNLLEWKTCPDGDVILKNGYGQEILCAPVKPWIVTDIPVEQPYLRGQWNLRVRPRVGDKGILSVFYHDIANLKESGGFQTPAGLRTMQIDSASWRPGLPNHADVNNESGPYPSDDEWEISGNDVSLKFSAPNDSESTADRQLDVQVGGVMLEIKVPQNGDPTVTFKAPNGAVNVEAKTANINLSDSATITASTATINGDISVNGTLNVAGATTIGATLKATGMVTGQDFTTATGVVVGTHVHSGVMTGPNNTGTPVA